MCGGGGGGGGVLSLRSIEALLCYACIVDAKAVVIFAEGVL